MKTQKDFGAVGIFCMILVLGLLAGATLVVFHKTSNPQPTVGQTSQKAAVPTQKYTSPADYMTFASPDGFSLSYPQVYGDFVKQAPQDDAFVLASNVPGQEYGPGISGSLRIYARQPFNAVITSRKYGPRIQLQNGKWIVVEASESDTVNKKGDEYHDVNNKTTALQTNGSLTVYTLLSGDEGIENDSLVFTMKGKQYQVLLPTFDSGSYSSTSVLNDKTAFNLLTKNVRDSIRITNE